MENDSAARRQVLRSFESNDPNYYNSPPFRTIFLREAFGDQVRRKIGKTIGIPYGLLPDDPDVDDLTDETFSFVQRRLDGDRIASLSTPLSRCARCASFLLRVAAYRALSFKTKNPFIWNHGDFDEDLRGEEPVTEDEHLSYEALAEGEQDEQDAAVKEKVREVLTSEPPDDEVVSPRLTEQEFEVLWLYAVHRLDMRELQALLGKSYAATRMQIHRLRGKTRQILNDPEILRRLLEELRGDEGDLGEDHDEHDKQ